MKQRLLALLCLCAMLCTLVACDNASPDIDQTTVSTDSVLTTERKTTTAAATTEAATVASDPSTWTYDEAVVQLKALLTAEGEALSETYETLDYKTARITTHTISFVKAYTKTKNHTVGIDHTVTVGYLEDASIVYVFESTSTGLKIVVFPTDDGFFQIYLNAGDGKTRDHHGDGKIEMGELINNTHLQNVRHRDCGSRYCAEGGYEFLPLLLATFDEILLESEIGVTTEHLGFYYMSN